ncbi:MAG: DUF2096 family protein [Candidatus Bathyarchaeia archaeon]
MNWEARWKILADVITELYRVGETVPPNILNDLRSAKVMIEVLKVDRSHPDNLTRLEEYLNNVESYVLSAAGRRFGEKYANDILRKLEIETGEFGTETQIRFYPSLPKGEKWIRVQVTNEAPLEVIERLARESGLKIRVERDGYVLVYGGENEIKVFVSKLTEVFHKSRKE